MPGTAIILKSFITADTRTGLSYSSDLQATNNTNKTIKIQPSNIQNNKPQRNKFDDCGRSQYMKPNLTDFPATIVITNLNLGMLKLHTYRRFKTKKGQTRLNAGTVQNIKFIVSLCKC